MTPSSRERKKNPLSTERVIEALLMALLLFLPLAFGGVEARSQLIGLGAALALSVLVCVRSIIRRERFIWTWAYVPLVLFFSLAVLQIIPLPVNLLRWIAPGTLALREKLLAGSAIQWATMSLYPQGTWNLLPVVAIASLTFVSVLNFVRHPEQVHRLLMAIALIGGAVAVLALLQDFSGAKAIYWMVPLPVRATGTGGPFINYNNFSQFMNLSIGAALAVFFIGLQQFLAGKMLDGNRLGEFITGQQASGQRVMLAVIACCAIAIPLSTSRAGTIAFVLGLFLITGIFAFRGKGQLWIAAFIGVAIFGGLVMLGFDQIYDRLSSLYHLEEASGGRWQMNGDVWAAIGPFLPSGIGLGAHEMVYPAFNREPLRGIADHLENDYLQLLEELGIPGALLVLWFLLHIIHAMLRSLLRPSRTIQAAVVGLAFGLAAVAVQSVTDFGQRIPAIACLSAIFCALLLVLNRLRHGDSEDRERPAARRRPRQTAWMAWLAMGVVALGTTIPLLAGLANAAAAKQESDEAQVVETRLTARNWAGNDSEFVLLLRHANSASTLQPENIAYHYQLDVYRWYAINVPPEKRPPAPPDGSESLLNSTHQPRSALVIGSPEYQAFTRHIVDDLLDARKACPTYGQLYCFAGQLEMFVLHDPAGEQHIRQGYQLAPSNPTVCQVAGTLDVQEQHWDASLEKFRRCLELHTPLRDLLEVYVNQADRPDLAVALAGNSPEKRVEVAQFLAATGKHADIAASLESSVFEEVSTHPEGEPANVLAWAGRKALDDHQMDVAEKLLRMAIDVEYSQADWRIMYAQALLANGKTEEALHEVHVALRLNPQSDSAKRMLDLIVKEPSATAGVQTKPSTMPSTKPSTMP